MELDALPRPVLHHIELEKADVVEQPAEVEVLLGLLGKADASAQKPRVARDSPRVTGLDGNVGVHRADENLAHMGEVVLLRVLEPHVLDRDRRLISEAPEERLVVGVEARTVLLVEELENADDLALERQRHAENPAGHEARGPAEAGVDSRS